MLTAGDLNKVVETLSGTPTLGIRVPDPGQPQVDRVTIPMIFLVLLVGEQMILNLSIPLNPGLIPVHNHVPLDFMALLGPKSS